MLHRITGSMALAFNEEGVCSMEYGGRLVILEISEPAESLVVYGAVASLGSVAAGDENAILRTLLALNLSSADLMGAAFALEPEQDAVVLTYRVPLAGLDAGQLEAAINAFLVLLDVWSARLLRAEELAELSARFTPDEVEEAVGPSRPRERSPVAGELGQFPPTGVGFV